MNRAVAFFLALIAAFVLQTTVMDLLAVVAVRPSLPLLLFVGLVLRLAPIGAVALGFVSGLVGDLIAGTPLGLNALALSLVGFIVRLATRDWIEVWYPRMIQVWALGAVIYETLVSGIYGLGSDLGFLGVFFRYVVPAIVYDLVFGVIVLAALPARIWRKL